MLLGRRRDSSVPAATNDLLVGIAADVTEVAAANRLWCDRRQSCRLSIGGHGRRRRR